ncbi:MAG: D-glycerate dehydrogenase [Candidatus Aminicenantes bacterium]|nr:D-glycerate dehydrogenase [Candidatus Aminicenantes bacterium]
MKPKVLVTHRLLPEAWDFLMKHAELELGTEGAYLPKDDLIAKIKDKEGLLPLLTAPIDRDVMDAAPGLKIIANCAVGYDNIDTGYAKKKGIMVTNTPGVLTETTADLTWALMLAVARKIPQADRFTRQKKYKGWELDLFLGKEITGKCLGIIGMGRIGKAVALRAQSFRMKVVYTDPTQLGEEEEAKFNAIHMSLDELLSTADFVTIHTALNPQTFHLITGEKLSLMKEGAVLINVARGPVVDEKALAEALESGRIWGAGLDVYEREPEIEERLLHLDNAVLLPHIGSASYETRLKMAMMAAKNLIQGLSGQKPDNLVT